MNKAILISAMLLSYYYGAAQSLTTSNYTPNIVHPNPFQTAQVSVIINNLSASSKDVMVERTINVLASGHTSYFCWGIECYAETISVSNVLSAPHIAAGSSDSSFYFDLDPHGVTGQDTGCYKFFDMSNASDFVEICFYVDVTTGIANVNASAKNPLSVPSPNPANTFSGINYYTEVTKNPKLVIYNLLGEKVFETNLAQKQGAYIINVTGFNQGIYLYSLIENGKTVATQKLVVAHK